VVCEGCHRSFLRVTPAVIRTSRPPHSFTGPTAARRCPATHASPGAAAAVLKRHGHLEAGTHISALPLSSRVLPQPHLQVCAAPQLQPPPFLPCHPWTGHPPHHMFHCRCAKVRFSCVHQPRRRPQPVHKSCMVTLSPNPPSDRSDDVIQNVGA